MPGAKTISFAIGLCLVTAAFMIAACALTLLLVADILLNIEHRITSPWRHQR